MEKYEILFDEYIDEKIARIKLTSGEWNGIVYRYGNVKFKRRKKDFAILKFDYDVISVPNNIDIKKMSIEEKSKFETLLGDILVELITEAASEIRTNNIV